LPDGLITCVLAARNRIAIGELPNYACRWPVRLAAPPALCCWMRSSAIASERRQVLPGTSKTVKKTSNGARCAAPEKV